MAKKKYTPATVEMKRLTVTFSRSFTSPVNSQMVSPVTMLNSSTIASGLRNEATMAATKMMPVTVLTIKFFIVVLVFWFVFFRIFRRFLTSLAFRLFRNKP